MAACAVFPLFCPSPSTGAAGGSQGPMGCEPCQQGDAKIHYTHACTQNAASALRISSVRQFQTDFFSMAAGEQSPVVLETGVPLRDSVLWKLQSSFYDTVSVDAWAKAIVPNFVSSNSFLAKSYARMVLGFARDWFLGYGQQSFASVSLSTTSIGADTVLQTLPSRSTSSRLELDMANSPICCCTTSWICVRRGQLACSHLSS